jgi:hypothetical protein
MKHYIDAHCINPTDVKRKIPQLTLAPDLKRGIYVPWQSRFEQLDAVLQEIAEFTGIGWEIYLDLVNKAWIFDIVEGRDLTTAQAVNIPVIFSVEFDNIKGQHYTDSALNLKTVGYAGGQGEEELRLIQQIGDAEGLGRLETFLDCSDAADADELLANGQQKLAELKQAQSFEVNISPSGSFIYGTDWDLGDLVTVRSSKWGITMHSRITEVKEIYESSGFNLEATFGNSIPTIVDKIKQSFKQNSIPIRR